MNYDAEPVAEQRAGKVPDASMARGPRKASVQVV
jgi:hypothetical protein